MNKALEVRNLKKVYANGTQALKGIDLEVEAGEIFALLGPEAMRRAEKYLKQLSLWDKRDVVSRSLSGGMKRRLMIARAMMNEPRLLILDEPTAGVDIEIRRSMWDFVRQINAAGTTVILTTHYLEEAEQLCKNVAIIDHGEIIRNTTIKQLLSTLDVETFIFDLDHEPDEKILQALGARVLDDHSIEVDVPKSRALNGVIKLLDAHGYRVLSMRNKANRLEELFLKMTQASPSTAETEEKVAPQKEQKTGSHAAAKTGEKA